MASEAKVRAKGDMGQSSASEVSRENSESMASESRGNSERMASEVPPTTNDVRSRREDGCWPPVSEAAAAFIAPSFARNETEQGHYESTSKV